MKKLLQPPIQSSKLTDKDGNPTSHHYRWMDGVVQAVTETDDTVSALSTSVNTSITGINTSLTSINSSISTLSTQKLTRIASKNALTSPATDRILFDSIPSWVKRITLNCFGVRTTSGGSLYLNIGAGTTPETSSYISTVITAGTENQAASLLGRYSTGGLLITLSHSANLTICGSCVLSSVNDTTWVLSGNLGQQATTNSVTGTLNANVFSSAGQKSLSIGSSLGCVQIIASAGNFSAGSINILYE